MLVVTFTTAVELPQPREPRTPARFHVTWWTQLVFASLAGLANSEATMHPRHPSLPSRPAPADPSKRLRSLSPHPAAGSSTKSPLGPSRSRRRSAIPSPSPRTHDLSPRLRSGVGLPLPPGCSSSLDYPSVPLATAVESRRSAYHPHSLRLSICLLSCFLVQGPPDRSVAPRLALPATEISAPPTSRAGGSPSSTDCHDSTTSRATTRNSVVSLLPSSPQSARRARRTSCVRLPSARWPATSEFLDWVPP
ncbi:hypothetical protein Emed_000824 [Eimeria media]